MTSTPPRVEILRDDPDFLAVLKPAGLLTHGNRPGDRSVVTELQALGYDLPDLSGDFAESKEKTDLAALRPGIIHRLDADTAGILIVARRKDFAEAIRADWQNVEKLYRAIVVGLAPERGRIEAPLARVRAGTTKRSVSLSGKPAVTEFHRLRVIGEGEAGAGSRVHGTFSEIRARILTGRTHQIRAHFRAIGHPLVGDVIYGDRGADQLWKKLGGKAGLRLCAESIEFRSPRTGEVIHIDAGLPEDFAPGA